jgi:hypothetical protein
MGGHRVTASPELGGVESQPAYRESWLARSIGGDTSEVGRE